MKRRIAGKTVRGAVALELPVPDVCVIREAARVSQSQFAKLIGVNLRTLQNWEQHRTRPTGPARALLKIVASNSQAIEAHRDDADAWLNAIYLIAACVRIYWARSMFDA